jgi:hypothetical protein
LEHIYVTSKAYIYKLAVSLASSLQLDHFILEGDSQVVLSALQNLADSQDWKISSLIMRTLGSIPAFSSWKANKIVRNANFCAHLVAHLAATRFFSSSIPIYPSPFSVVPIVSGKDPPLVAAGFFPDSFALL